MAFGVNKLGNELRGGVESSRKLISHTPNNSYFAAYGQSVRSSWH